jgi:small subunit ribosomal protein S9
LSAEDKNEANEPEELEATEPEQPAAEEPEQEQPAEEAAPAEPVADAPAAADEPVAEAPAAEEPDEPEEIEATPRVKPEIPGADLEVDIVREGDEGYRESRWSEEGDEEEADEAAEDEDAEPQPIADAAIDLAAGARYTATGKRKTAVARVILKPGTGAYVINGRTLEQHFPRFTLQRNIRQPLEQVGYESRMDVVATMHGGGVSAQAGALRHGISRALIEADPNLRSELKRRGFLTRDARVKERKKAGLKKARKRPQFSKR